eukprot:2402635-Rhodomonas_salina.5
MSQPVPKDNNSMVASMPVTSSETMESDNVGVLTRVINVSLCGSLEELSQGGEARCKWAPMQGKHVQVFGLDSHNELGIDNNSATNSLRTATILKARLLESKSSFPWPLGVTVSCLPKNEITETGDRYAYTVLPDSSMNTPHVLYQADSDFKGSNQWRQQYKEYNASNLDTQGILEVKNCPYVFVKDSHPVIAVLRANTELIGQNIDNMPKIDGEWYKLSRNVLQQCCSALRTHVLSKLSTHDLNHFQVNVDRMDKQDWIELGDMSCIKSRMEVPFGASSDKITMCEDEAAHRFLTTPYEYHSRIELTYELQH